MTEDPTRRKNWQISLANVLVFVFAVAFWFLVVTKLSHLLAPITLIVMLAGVLATIFAWLRKLRGILVLLFLFEVIVMGSLLGGEYFQMLATQKIYARKRVLHSLSTSFSRYYGDWDAFPPPPADSKSSGTELARFLLTTRKKVNAPYTSLRPRLTKNGTPELVGATEHTLVWVLPDTENFILVDVGNDTIAGKYIFQKYEPLRVASDVNGDGVDDAEDDIVMDGSWDGVR